MQTVARLENQAQRRHRLPKSGNAALAAGALVQAALGTVFLIAGLSKLVAANYVHQFTLFLEGSAGARGGAFAPLVQGLLVPNAQLVAELALFAELIGGAVLLVGALEVARRRLSGPIGAEHGYEPLVALLSAVAAVVVGGVSLSIFVLQGGRLPTVNPALALVSPVSIELLMVPLAVGITWLELARFAALRAAPSTAPR